ncbi:hypothetical protein ON010_g8163 [Phytophthora cinnamomi]|nr:hypothetical protein ON010_g8163 [Phytophthora cinnamomi]
MALVRYALLLIALVGAATIAAANQANSITSGPAHATLPITQGHDTKRILRQASKTATADDDSKQFINADGEERTILTTFAKTSLYELLAAFRIHPQTLYVHLGIRSGTAPAILHRFYNSYHRWYTTNFWY